MSRPARSGGPSPLGRLLAWAAHHGHSSLSTLGRLSRTPLASAMTLAVIGIAMALPAGLHVLVDNARQLSGTWERALEVSVFLDPGAPAPAAHELAGRLRARAGVGAVRVITADEALSEFRERSGFGAALDILRDNPLPAVLVVTPAPDAADAGSLAQMADEIEALPEVDLVQLDMRWLQRLLALLDIAERAIAAVAVLLGIAVIVTVGNTIRLDIQNRRNEIEVIKLIGGSDAFIRRPFLYTGLWYGLGGGLAAWLLVSVGLMLMGGPVARLAGLYGSAYSLGGPGVTGLLALCAGGAFLGWAGSWVAVGRHLHEIEP